MPTLAELEIRVDSGQTENATKALKEFAKAAREASEASKLRSTSETNTGESTRKNTKAVSEATKEYDLQAKKLRELAEAKKKLDESTLKTSDPEKYKREVAAIDAIVGKLKLQGNAQEQLQAKWAAMDLAQKRSTDRQQTNIDTVISGLSRQAKAQIDYNRTLEELNRARGIGAGKAGGISEAEYDSYKRLAQAQRDNVLAAIDNTKEQTRAQAQIDSIAGTLGRAEKAQYLYAQRVKQITEASKTLGLTEQQTAALISPHTDKLNQQLSVINANAEAQTRFNKELNSAVVAYDPVSRATVAYNTALNTMLTGLSGGKITVEQFNQALTSHRVALDKVKAAQPDSEQSQAKKYQDAIDRLLPYNAQLRNLEAAEKALNQAQAQGRVVTDEQIKAHNKAKDALAAERIEVDRLTQATDRRGNSAKQNAAALRGLPAQFTDIVVSLQGGQAPLTVFLQQGGQIKDMFGGVKEAVVAVSKAVYAMVTPFTVAGAALAVLGVALYQGSQEANNFNKAMAASANFSGATTSNFLNLQKSIYALTGVAGQAAEAMTLLQASGKVVGENFEAITLAAIKMNRVAGQSIKDTVAEFVSLGKDPASAVLTLNEKYNFLTSSVYAQIASLERQGQAQAATNLAQAELARGAEEMANRIKPQLGTLETGWNALRDAAKGAWDGMLDFGREKSLEDQLADVQKRIVAYNSGFLSSLRKGTLENSPVLRLLNEEQQKLIQSISATNKRTQAESELTRAKKEGVAAQAQLNSLAVSNASPVKNAEREIERAKGLFKKIEDEAKVTGIAVSAEQVKAYTTLQKDLAEKLEDAKKTEANKNKTPSSPVDSRNLEEVKSNTSAIVREYDNYYKKITAIGKTGVVSQEATVASQLSILSAQKKAVDESYNSQIEAIKKLQGVSTNNAAQKISLDNQLTRVQEAQLKSQEDIDAKMEELKIKEEGRLTERGNAIKSYADALRESVDNIEEQGRRQVAALGKGDRQGKVDGDLAANDRAFAKGLRSLDDQRKGMDPVEYAEKLAILRKEHNLMADAILKNDADIKEAEQDWTNGVSKAYENYIDESKNLAGSLSGVVTSAFSSMDDALTSFVTTGKISFSSFASSIIADMARIAVKQASSSLLSGLVNLGISAYSAYSGTGANGFASGSSAAQSSSLGASSAGYSTKYFAKGGAFTNSILTGPTEFTLASGQRAEAGEAGPEAIMPLTRTADGSLGVRIVGGPSESSVVDGMIINIYISEGQASAEVDGGNEDTATAKEFARQMGAIAAAKYQELMKKDLSDGGQIKTAITNR